MSRRITATDPGAPFGGGVSSMGGGNQSGSGQAQEASPTHQGPPPAAAGASHVLRCNECGYNAKDGGDLEEHLRKEHFVRQTLSRNDITVPAALIFIDGLGDTIPFKTSFTFKELSDFCHREGVNVLAGERLTEENLIGIAEHIAILTNNHVTIEARPTVAATRQPLSAVDLHVASESASHECRRCQTKIATYRIFCDDCSQRAPVKETTSRIGMYAHVVLNDGTGLHVVEITGDTYTGVDDLFIARTFTAADAAKVHNLDDDLRTVEAAQCNMCGEEVYEFASKCANCGYAGS